MKRNSVLIIIVSILGFLLIVGGILYIRQFIPKHKWHVSYSIKSDEPYGAQFIYKVLKKTTDNEQFHTISKSLKNEIDSLGTNSLYVFIGGNYFLDSSGLEKLMHFVERGNTAFIASNMAPYQLFYDLPYRIDPLYEYEDQYDSTVAVKFSDDSDLDTKYNFHFQYLKHKSTFDWKYFSQEAFDYANDFSYRIYSRLHNDGINMLGVKYGKGEFIFHTNPVLFTNYYIINKKGYNYVNDVFSVAGEYDEIYWDEFSKVPDMTYSGDANFGDSPFRFILSKESFRYAMYLTLGLIVLYLLFHSKRIQAVIPIYEPKKNTSIEFVRAIGMLYSKKSTHINLGKDIMNLFLLYVRSRYGINTNQEREVLIKRIALKSEIPEKKVKQIFDYHYSVKYNPNVDKPVVIQLHQSIENFYKNCK